jgi:hypothetical protein
MSCAESTDKELEYREAIEAAIAILKQAQDQNEIASHAIKVLRSYLDQSQSH